MFSRLVLLLSFVALAACTPKVGEEPPPSTMSLPGNTACLSSTSEIMKDFFAGKAQSGEVDSGWQCIEDAFKTFNRYFVGARDPQKIYPEEMATFFEKYFVELEPISRKPKNHISKELQVEFMKVKQLLLGGSREYLTRAEFARIGDIISKLRNLSKKVNRYMGVYTLNWKATGDDYSDSDFFEGANTSLQDFSRDVSELMVPDHQPYSFDDFFGLLDQLGKFYNENWEFVSTVKKYMPLVSKIKKVVAGGPEDRIHHGEWKSFLLLGARAYVQYTRYVYFLKESPTGTSIRLGHIANAASDLMSAFEDLLYDKPERDTRPPGNRTLQASGKISREEMDELLAALKQVWPEFKYSDALVDEVMLLKQVIFGGSEKYWTALDFETAKFKVPYIKDILEKIMPYYSVYINEWNPNRYTEEKAQIFFKQSQNNLSEALSQVGILLESSYSLSQLSKLLKEVERLYPGTIKGQRLDETYDKYLPLVTQAKNLLFEDQDDVIHKVVKNGKVVVNQWPQFLSITGQLYSFYLHYNYFIGDRSIEDSKVLFSLRYLADSTFATLGNVLDIKPSHKISAKETADLVLDLQDLEIISKKIQTKTIERFVNAALNSLLNPHERRLKGEFPLVIDKPVLANVKYELSAWLETEIFLKDIFGDPNRHLNLTPFELQKAIDEKAIEVQGPGPLKDGLEELKRILSSSVPLIIDSQGRLQISANVPLVYSVESVSRLNLTRAASRALIRAYAGTKERVQGKHGEGPGSVTKDEANFAYYELKDPFVDLEILEPDDEDFMTNRFLEANIFVPRGDGNNEASFLELSDIVNTIFSGVEINSQMQPVLFDGQSPVPGCLPGAEDPPSTTKVNYDCLRLNYKYQMPLKLDSMPDYVNFLNSNDACESEILFFNLMKAAGYVPNNAKEVMLSDIGLLPHIIQYIELILARFDTDKSGTLTLDEAERAWPTFHDLFKDLSKSYNLPEEALFPLFTWVLKKGRIPSGSGDFTDFAWWWKFTKPQNRKINTDRNKLGAILGVVADQMATQKLGPISEWKKIDIEMAKDKMFHRHLSSACSQRVKKANRPKNPSDFDFQAP